MITVYGIPSCGTVKKALSALTAAELTHEFVDFRGTPPDAAQVARWVQEFGAPALRNTSGGSYRALGPEKDTWSEAQWTAAFHADPMLIKRPVIERDGKPMVVGFRDAPSAVALLR